MHSRGLACDTISYPLIRAACENESIINQQEDKIMATTVIFRKDKPSEGGNVFALFPDMPGSPGCCTCYQHVGQHSSADYILAIATSTPATEEQYHDLLAELVSIGYDDLKIRKRYTRG